MVREASPRARLRVRPSGFVSLLALAAASSTACHARDERPVLPRSQTWAELRTVRRSVTVAPPGEGARAPYPRERLVDGEVVKVDDQGLAWLRRDGGATLLVERPGGADASRRLGRAQERTRLRRHAVRRDGRALDARRRSFTCRASGQASRSEARRPKRTCSPARCGPTARCTPVAGERARSIERQERAARLAGARLGRTGRAASRRPSEAAEPSPYGVGTVGARRAGEQGAPRFPLAIQKLDVKVTIDKDLAITEVDELFFNPSSEVVEGVYRFRTPDGATLHRFGVDKDGVIDLGPRQGEGRGRRAARYQANVYQGSTEDPALLEWDAPGVYRARLYPIAPGETRRVVVRYAEWLGRTGAKGERRLYVYPMAAEGTEASLPHIEEMSARIELAQGAARRTCASEWRASTKGRTWWCASTTWCRAPISRSSCSTTG